jgi:hypothetical protein
VCTEKLGMVCDESGKVPLIYSDLSDCANEIIGKAIQVAFIIFEGFPCTSPKREHVGIVRFLMIRCVVNCQLSLSMVI